MGIKLRQSTNGRELVGTVAGQVPVWNPATQEWDAGTAGGILTNLSHVWYVDFDTSVPLASQTGNIEAPFANLQTAIDAAVHGDVLMVVAAFDAGYPACTIADKNLVIIGLSEEGSSVPVVFDSVTLDNATVWFSNCAVSFTADESEVRFRDCQFGGTMTGVTATVFAENSQQTGTVSGSNNYTAFNTELNIITDADVLTARMCVLAGDITLTGDASDITLQECTTVGAIVITDATIILDDASLRSFVFAGGTFTGCVVSGYSGTVITFGAAAATGGEFIDQGSRANPVSFPAEDTVRSFIGLRRVACALKVYSNTNMTFTLRKNAADTLLAVTVAGAEGSNRDTFIVFEENDTFDMGILAAAPGQAICAVTFV